MEFVTHSGQDAIGLSSKQRRRECGILLESLGDEYAQFLRFKFACLTGAPARRHGGDAERNFSLQMVTNLVALCTVAWIL